MDARRLRRRADAPGYPSHANTLQLAGEAIQAFKESFPPFWLWRGCYDASNEVPLRLRTGVREGTDVRCAEVAVITICGYTYRLILMYISFPRPFQSY